MPQVKIAPAPTLLPSAVPDSSGSGDESAAWTCKGPGSPRSTKRRVTFIANGGDVVDVGSLAVPDQVKSVLAGFDFSSEGNIDIDVVDRSMRGLAKVARASGSCDVEGNLALLSRLISAERSSSHDMEYNHLPAPFRKILSTWDADGNGTISAEELVMAAQAQKQLQDRTRLLVRIAMAAVLLAIILLVGVFTLSLVTAELAKEVRTEADGRMTAKSGAQVLVGSSDFTLHNGRLVMRHYEEDGSSTPSRRLDDGNRTVSPRLPNTLATMQSKQKLLLSSSLPSSFFDQLAEMAVYSDRGFSLSLQVHGFSRVPVLNSRCGNIVTLYTAWGGQIILDHTDLSFDKQLALQFQSAGFEVAAGGAAGRRLSEQYSSSGFFNHIEDVDDEGWQCHGVPLPLPPKTYMRVETRYSPCAAGVQTSMMGSCESRYGGRIPGTVKLDTTNAIASLGKASRFRVEAGTGSAADAIEKMDWLKVNTIEMKSPSWEVQQDRYANHPSQERVVVLNRHTKESTWFQRTLDTGDRSYCRVIDPSGNPQAKFAELEQDSSVDTEMHFEFMDIVEERSQFYRHFRLIPSATLMAWSLGNASEPSSETGSYEYWDSADTLRPHRMLLPDGSMILFDEVKEGMTDDEVENVFVAMGLSTESVLRCNVDTEEERDVELPELLSPKMDLGLRDIRHYTQWLDEHDHDDNSTAAWPLGDFVGYIQRAQTPSAMADVCLVSCRAEVEGFFDVLTRTDDDDEIDETLTAEQEHAQCEALSRAMNCLRKLPETRCMKSPFVISHQGDATSCSALRRLQGVDSQDRRLHQVQYSVTMDREKLVSLPDGSKVLDMSSLPGQDLQALSEILQLGDLTDARLVLGARDNHTSAASLLVGGSSAERRLESRGDCSDKYANTFVRHPIIPVLGSGIEQCIWWSCTCDPEDDIVPCTPGCQFKKPYYSASLKIITGVGGESAGKIKVEAGGELDLGHMFGISPPLFGKVSLSGEIETVIKNVCPGVNLGYQGKVSLAFVLGVEFCGYDFEALKVSLEAGAGRTVYKTNCRSFYEEGGGRRRRWWDRRRWVTKCDEACDVSIYGKMEVEVNIWVAGARAWVKYEYYMKARDTDVIVGVDGWIAWSPWFNVVTRELI